ncbi:GGDEF domain [Candidatus Nanopelagicaceae bacterium]
MYRVLRWAPLWLLTSHIAFKAVFPDRSVLLDLILYNAIWIMAIAAITQSPLTNDPVALAAASLAITFWGFGSILNSYGDFYSLPEGSQLLAQLSYTLFYPLALVAIPRSLARGRKLNPLELLDSAIFGLGISSIATALFLTRVFPQSLINLQDQFFSLLFPICDLLLLIIASIALVTHRLQIRATLLFFGIALFSMSDLLYLWLAVNGSYRFGQLTDDGWLIGIVLIAASFWLPQSKSEFDVGIHPAFLALSIFISPTLLALIALRPGIFPIYIVAPAVATLFMALFRMTIVIRQAKNLGEEKVLARTDDITGLPNRRRLIAELATFSKTEGALLLLDLDEFKPVNDSYGHEVGNVVLQQVAQRFTRSLPTGSVLARLGGDEFGVLINGSYEETLEAAYALQATCSYPFLVEGHSIKIGVSIGHVQNDDAGDLLERADAAMYEAKRNGVGVVQASRP